MQFPQKKNHESMCLAFAWKMYKHNWHMNNENFPDWKINIFYEFLIFQFSHRETMSMSQLFLLSIKDLLRSFLIVKFQPPRRDSWDERVGNFNAWLHESKVRERKEDEKLNKSCGSWHFNNGFSLLKYQARICRWFYHTPSLNNRNRREGR